MAGNQKATSDIDRAATAKKAKAPPRARNRASPYPIVKTYDHLTRQQKDAIHEMGFGSLLDIKCHKLHNPLIDWLARLYDSETREVVVPGRGRIQMTEESVHRILGIPRGSEEVIYAVDSETEDRLAPGLFGEDGNTPKTTRVAKILEETRVADERFKQIWMMYAICTLLSPTTRNHVSNRCYHVLGNIGCVHQLNWCKFVADQLHVELAKGKYTRACLLYLMLLYVDSLDVSKLGIELPNAQFAINVWSKEAIDVVLLADLQRDGKSFGKLELKRDFGINYCLFGGADSFEKWMEVNTASNCPKQERAKVAGLMASFASGMVGLMGALVQGWTGMQDQGSAEMARQFEILSSGLQSAHAHASSAAVGTSNAAGQRATVAAAGRRMTRSARTSGVAGRTVESRLSDVESDSDYELPDIEEDLMESSSDGSDWEDAGASLPDGLDVEDRSSDEDDSDSGLGCDEGDGLDVEREDEEEDSGGARA